MKLQGELIQDIFVHLWVNRHLLATVEHPTSYLFNVASNKTVRYLQKIANDSRLLDHIAALSPAYSNITEEQIILKDSLESIKAVAQLPEQRRRIWELSRNEGLTHEQIAEQLNISKNTVKNQIVDAAKFVRNFLDKRAGILSASIIILLADK